MLDFKEVKTGTAFKQRLALPVELGGGGEGDRDGAAGEAENVPCAVGREAGGPLQPVDFEFDAARLRGPGATYEVKAQGGGWVVAGMVKGALGEGGLVKVQGVPEEVGRLEGSICIEIFDEEGNIVGKGEGGRGYMCLPVEVE